MAPANTTLPVASMVEEPEKPADLKLIMLGDSAVGKSKMVERFMMEEYNPRTASTYALTLFRHTYRDSADKEWAVDIWDTAGQEQFNKLHASYYFQANVCVLVFDVTRKVTYKNLEKWYKEMRIYCPDIPVICIANKVDADPEIAKKRFNFAINHKLPFFFVSAADGTNIVRIFNEALKLAIKNKEEPADEVMAEIWNLLRDEDSGLGKLSAEAYDDEPKGIPSAALTPTSLTTSLPAPAA